MRMIQRVIRGSGLAYGAYISCDLESGLLNFSLYRVSGFGLALMLMVSLTL